MSGWIGVDLDGTLAKYDGWKGVGNIGEPITSMVERVKSWILEGREVRIFTARVAMGQRETALPVIEKWCQEHIGKVLSVTCEKDFGMIELWDDRCIRIITNKGEPCCK